ncbi:IS66 family transposase [Pseudomonas fluorescens]|uniref:IS66 family transposase n=1 Tax=Pseudomonas fluorescens TaxID=294 RepID=UPI0038573BE2
MIVPSVTRHPRRCALLTRWIARAAPRAHLENFSGILRAHGYAGFAQLYGSGSVQEVACRAHATRKFYDVYKDQLSPLTPNLTHRMLNE